MRTRGVYQDGTAVTAGGWRSAAAWLGVLVLACGRPDDGQGSSLPAASAADPSPGAMDEGAPPPEPAPIVIAGWTRDPATGECSSYADPDAVPDGGLRFDSDLECHCSSESCPSTIEEAERRLCAVMSLPANAVRFVGCGLVAVGDYTGDEWTEWTFEQPSASGGSATPAPRLVGAARYSAASSFDAGCTTSWSAGIDPAQCDYDAASTVCQLCGNDPPGYAPCP